MSQDGREEDGASIVSGTTNNSEVILPDIPAIHQHRLADMYRHAPGTDSQTQEFIGVVQPVVLDRQLPLQISPNKESNVTVGGDDDDCSEMSEVLIPLKRSLVKADTTGTQSVSINKESHRKVTEREDVSTEHTSCNVTPSKQYNTSLHRTRSSTQSQVNIQYERNKYHDGVKDPKSASTEVPSNLTSNNDDDTTDKLNMRISKLLNNIDKTPLRQQEVIKTAVEHCMVKLQDILERKLSHIHREMDNHRIKKLIVIIKLNLSRVMQFYKVLESQRSVPEQSTLFSMHLQHKKNLLAIVQRHKRLVEQFKDMDKCTQPRSSTSGSLNGTQTSGPTQNTEETKQQRSTFTGPQAETSQLSPYRKDHNPELKTRTVKELKRLAEGSLVRNKRKMQENEDFNYTDIDQTESGIVLKARRPESVMGNVKKAGHVQMNVDRLPSDRLWLHMLQDKQMNEDGTMISVDRTDKPDITLHPIDEKGGKGQGHSSCVSLPAEKSNYLPSNITNERGLENVSNIQSGDNTATLLQSDDDNQLNSQSDAGNCFSDEDSVDILTAKTITQCIAKVNPGSPNIKNTIEDSYFREDTLVKEDTKPDQEDTFLNQYKGSNQNADINIPDEVPHGNSLQNKPEIPSCGKGMSDQKETKLPAAQNVTDENTNYQTKHTMITNNSNHRIDNNSNHRIDDIRYRGTSVYVDLPRTPEISFSLNLPGITQTSPTSTCVSSDVFMVKTSELDRRLKQRVINKEYTQQSDILPNKLLNLTGEGSIKQQKVLQDKMFEDHQVASKMDIEGQSFSSHEKTNDNPVVISDRKTDEMLPSLPSWRELLTEKIFTPGPCVFSVTVQGVQYQANLTENGKLEDSRGILFNTPVKWLSSLYSGQTIKQRKAYQQILYRGKAIQHFCTALGDRDTPVEIKGAVKIISDKKGAVHSNPGRKQTIQTNPDRKQTIQTNPDRKQTIQTNADRKQTIQTNPDRKQTMQTNSDRKQTIQTNADRKQTIQTNPDRKQTIQTIADRKQTIQTNTADRKQTIQTNPADRKQTIQTNPADRKQTIQTNAADRKQTIQTNPADRKQTIQTNAADRKQTIQTNPADRKTIDQVTQTDVQDVQSMGDMGRHVNKLVSQSLVRLLSSKDFVSCDDLPENFWSEEFPKVKLDQTVWDSITVW